MEQQTQMPPVQSQSQPPVQPQQSPQVPPPPAGQQPPPKNPSKVWLWIIGGCLAIVIIAGLIMGGLAWWGAKKFKKTIQENQPKLEEMQKGAEEWQKEMEKAQEEWESEMEKMQNQTPDYELSD